MKKLLHISLLAGFITLTIAGHVQALSQEQKNIFDSGIYYFDASPSTSDCVGDINLIGSENAEKIFNFFISKGLSREQAAGAFGNIMRESGGDPENIQQPAGRTKDPSGLTEKTQGWGIIQWTPGSKIIGLAEKAGITTPIYELSTQLELVWEHMGNNPVVTKEFDLAYYKTLTDVVEAVKYFEDKIEGAGVKALDERVKFAKSALTKYGSGSTDSGDSLCTDSTMIKLSPPLTTSGDKITPKGITLHWWGGSSGGQGISNLVGTLKSRGLSVQIGITADGKVYQMTNDLLDYTSHATGGNNTTIGIEIEGGPADFNRDGITKYPQKFAAVVATVKYLVAKYNIPLEGQTTCGDVIGIHPHKDYNSCPGAEFKTDVDDEYFNAVMQAVRS
ncbi:hypothetical protein A3F65_02595 [Candidatus Saccharibacteria bacterium RIFCSPHIGHO2_12_FULL_47_16b]|nr:MAG: hypothetical protein A3F65_02595 [Candidatus Saccharibacteria bacterium RIFCSPHIGHO2_12_FULL_47_16b]OGL38740.1 MAG: hypothetical protein A3J32_01615 [Candidatus Saccharibacteria bacterium RIFCSPLOWO2_02_FULL_46_7]